MIDGAANRRPRTEPRSAPYPGDGMYAARPFGGVLPGVCPAPMRGPACFPHIRIPDRGGGPSYPRQRPVYETPSAPGGPVGKPVRSPVCRQSAGTRPGPRMVSTKSHQNRPGGTRPTAMPRRACFSVCGQLYGQNASRLKPVTFYTGPGREAFCFFDWLHCTSFISLP